MLFLGDYVALADSFTVVIREDIEKMRLSRYSPQLC